MAARVYLRDIEVLRNFDAELSQFKRGANTVLENTARNIKASQERLKAKMNYWQAELRLRQNAYEVCRRRGRNNCGAEANAVRQAQDALQKLKTLSIMLEQAIGEYLPHANQLEQLTQTKIKKANGDLRRSIQKYQNYLAHQDRGSASRIHNIGEMGTVQPQLEFGELDSSIDLTQQAELGGHSIDRHGPQIKLSELKERVSGNHPTMPQSRTSMKFINAKTHTEAVNRAFRHHQAEIQAHFASGGGYREWTFDCGTPTGIGFTNIGTRKNPIIQAVPAGVTTKVTICLKPHPTAPQGFYLVSAFPAYPQEDNYE